MPMEVNNLVIKKKPLEVASPHEKVLEESKKSERIQPSPSSSVTNWYEKRSDYLTDMISTEK